MELKFSKGSKLITINEEKTKDVETHPYYILQEYAAQVEEDLNGEFYGRIKKTDLESETFFSFFIVVPKLNDFMYRFIEVNISDISNPYNKLTVKFLPQNTITIDTCASSDEFKKIIERYLGSKQTSDILGD